jgi:hypothetical protein
VSTIPGNFPETSPPQEQPFTLDQMAPKPPAPPKKSRLGLIIALVIVGVVVVAGIAVAATVAVTGSGKPAVGSSTYKPIYGNPGNGGAPAAPVTTGPTYANPTAADFQITPKITQKQCFGSAGCNVTFTVDLAYVGKGAKPYSTWDITFDALVTKDAVTDTIKLHFDATGSHGTYDSTEEMVQTEKSSDPVPLRITNISPGIG